MNAFLGELYMYVSISLVRYQMFRDVTSQNMTMEVLHASLIISPPLHVFIHFSPILIQEPFKLFTMGEFFVCFFLSYFFTLTTRHSHENM